MDAHRKPEEIPPSITMLLHQATGMGVLQSKEFLEQASPQLYSRLVESILTGKKRNGCYYDPIEDEPDLAKTFDEVERQAEAEVEVWVSELCREATDDSEPVSHRVAGRARQGIKKRILQVKYGIEWFTSGEMNPGTSP